MQTFVKSIDRLKNLIILIKKLQFYINYTKDITKEERIQGWNCSKPKPYHKTKKMVYIRIRQCIFKKFCNKLSFWNYGNRKPRYAKQLPAMIINPDIPYMRSCTDM